MIAKRGIVALAACAVLTMMLQLTGCGGRSPVTPSPPGNGGGNQQPAVNTPPTIESITLAADRIEVDADVVVTAVVKDADTPPEQLKYEWMADAGTFSGEGASVTWKPPSGAATPQDYTLRLKVTEVYGQPDENGVRSQHVVEGTSPPVRVHDSTREVSDLVRTFLKNFSDSNVSPDVCVADFSDSCPGKREELTDITDNRKYYEILSASFSVKSVRFDAAHLKGDIVAPCEFTSRVKACPPNLPPGTRCILGSTEHVRGDCVLTSMYDKKRWWLCDSNFTHGDLLPTMKAFFGLR